MVGKKSSAEKRHKQSEVRRMRNKAAKSAVHTAARKFVEAVHAKDQTLASEKRILVVGAFITTAIRDRLFLVALADKLYKARDVEPVFNPVHPL